MADGQNTSGRGFFRRVGSEAVDRLFLGNKGHDYNSGYWNRQGAIEGGIQSGLGAINPALGLGARLYFRYRDGRSMPIQSTGLDPVQPMSFNAPQFNTGGALRSIAEGGQYTSPQFDPSNPFAMPQQQPQQSVGQGYGRFTPNIPQQTGGAFQSQLGNQGGGARGMFSSGGITGDAARSMFAGMQAASRATPIVDVYQRPYRS